MNNQYGKTDAIQDLKILGLSPSSFVDEQKLQASEEISSIYENLINMLQGRSHIFLYLFEAFV